MLMVVVGAARACAGIGHCHWSLVIVGGGWLRVLCCLVINVDQLPGADP